MAPSCLSARYDKYRKYPSHLQHNIHEYDKKWVGQVKEKPDLHRLDVGGAGQTDGYREVDRGQDHHAGDVDGEDQVVPGVPVDIIGDLVDHVHENYNRMIAPGVNNIKNYLLVGR